MADAPLLVDPADASPGQLLLAMYRTTLRLETRMSELTAAVSELEAAVDGVAQRLLPQIDALEAANERLAAELHQAGLDDAEAAAVLEEVVAATAAIRAQADELNSLGASNPEDPEDPEEPGDPGDPGDGTPEDVDPEDPVEPVEPVEP